MDIVYLEQNKKINLKCKYHADKNISLINVSDIHNTSNRIILCSECLAIG